LTNNLVQNIEKELIDFWRHSELNIVPELKDMQIYDQPLIGVATADDPLFTELKAEDAVGPQHLSPSEWLPGARSVISYFLPFSQEVRQANRSLGYAPKEWMYARIEGEQFNDALRGNLVQKISAMGVQAVSPALDSRYCVVNRRSNWSERHVAYISGLGTFSLSRSLITRRGSAGRFGSLIVDALIDPTPREYQSREEYCSKCGACILRCPPLAITEAGKDNRVCGDYMDRVRFHFNPRYGCGKCQAGVPCEQQIPLKKNQN
jgi:epoxyqueuosine reductase QueG